MESVSVLFVCLGNICRSPIAEGLFRVRVESAGLLDRIVIDSAGTSSYHIGAAPDARALAAAAERGIDLSSLRARQATSRDLELFDYVIAMDRANRRELERLAGERHHGKIRLFMEWAPDFPDREVPDPYYGGANGFARVLDMVEVAADGLLEDIRRRLGPG
jgi:protein-tyrosine phosphatase